MLFSFFSWKYCHSNHIILLNPSSPFSVTTSQVLMKLRGHDFSEIILLVSLKQIRLFYKPCYKPESDYWVGNYPNLKKRENRYKKRWSDLLTIPDICLASDCMDYDVAYDLMCKTQFLWGGQGRYPFTNEDTEAQTWVTWPRVAQIETDVIRTWPQILWCPAHGASPCHITVALTNLNMVRGSAIVFTTTHRLESVYTL